MRRRSRNLAELLRTARKPLILAGRVSRSRDAWKRRIELAERLGAKVLTDAKVAAAFPSHHPLHPFPPTLFLSEEGRRLVADSDVILSLDWVDLGGTLKTAFGTNVTATIANASLDFHLHRGWNMEYYSLPVVDIPLAADPDAVVSSLLAVLAPRHDFPEATPRRGRLRRNPARSAYT